VPPEGIEPPTQTKPLRDWEQGVTVLAGPGNLVAIERGGVEHKEFGSYLFGEIDVPTLETFETPLQPFDPSRSLTLNPKHPVVAVLLGFVGSKLEQVRQELVAQERGAREQEEARRLARRHVSTGERSGCGHERECPHVGRRRLAPSRVRPHLRSPQPSPASPAVQAGARSG
jgi:hypothetical protein